MWRLVELQPSRQRLLAVRRPLILAVSAALAVLSYLSAFYIRADFTLPETWRYGIVRSLPFLLVARLLSFQYYRLFQGWWAGAGMPDFLDVVKAVCVGSALFVSSIVIAFGVYAVPRSVVVIDAVLLTGLVSGMRLLSRFWARAQNRPKTKRTVIVGRIPSVESLLREVLDNPDIPLQPVALIDLEARHRGLRLHGIPILGGEDDLPKVLAAERIGTVLLAVSPREAATIRRILSRCDRPSIGFKIVPPLEHVLRERYQVGDLRDLEVDDLLGRDEIRLDGAGIREALTGRRILITGAAGSIGSELARQVAAHGPEELVLLDRNEAALGSLADELRSRFPTLAVAPRLGDLRHGTRTRQLLADHRPDIVYHAAAYKHVPLMEMNPTEAAKNNILGTRELLDACDAAGVDKFILISTDKAVNPINIMGTTKRIAERLLEEPGGGCRRIAVRFGNVFGSDGSVVPILLRQIRDGGPVTITDPDATRYFMTIPEAVQLVIQASTLGTGGEIFVLEMGEPVRILDLARSIIRLSGLRPDRDIQIRFTGLRPGERLHEETLIDSFSRPTGHEKIWVRPAGNGAPPLSLELPLLEEMIRANDHEGVLRWLRRLSTSPSEGS